MSSIRLQVLAGLKKGDTFSLCRTFTEEDVRLFAETSKDYNPVHFNDRFAAEKNFKGRICHGLLVASLLTEIGGQLGWLASGINLMFRKPVYIGDTICCDFTITNLNAEGRAEAEVIFSNAENTIVLEAVLTGILPNDNEKEIIRNILADD